MLAVDHISVGYAGKTLAEGITFRLEPGECVLLCGANGSGKTTLLRTLAGLDSGCVMLPARIPKVPGFTLRAFIRTGCYRENSLGGKLTPEGEKALEEALELLGISHLGDQDIATLSDGEFQKGCIATALVRRAETLLLDEPTAFLDADSRLAVLQALRTVSRTRAVLFSSHDLQDSAAVCTRIMGFSRDGRFLDTAAGWGREALLKECFREYGR
ncbi:MAG: ABC transporter ATP-binding protein [Bacteroidales bacterium]|nr:ABC transporter ATP-binding protein [Bacteroidales bacterium]